MTLRIRKVSYYYATVSDRPGALLDIHCALRDARINTVSSQGVTSAEGRFGYIIHARSDDFDRAAQVLDAA